MVFLDASAIIYLFEGNAAAVRAVQGVLSELHSSAKESALGVSALSRLECRIGPLRTGNQALLERYDTFFADPGLVVVPLENDVIDLATDLRARHSLRTPDALQAASLLSRSDAGVFVTGDDDFQRVPGLNVRRIEI